VASGLVLPLEVYAAVMAEVWDAAAPLDAVLERHGIAEEDFRLHERRQAEALDREADEGRAQLALALVGALDAARAQKAGPGSTKAGRAPL
jgi:hypothetical protein